MDYEIIGTRSGSAFRVPLDYFFDKRDRFQPFVDPTTGGPVAIVYEGTDDLVDKAKVTMVRDRTDKNWGRVYVDESPVKKPAADKPAATP